MSLTAVNFHYIRQDFDAPYPSIYGVTPEQFRSQLETLRKLGTIISQAQLKDYLESGSGLPERALMITFDDGLREQYELALPILDDLEIPAIFFVNTRPLEEIFVLNVHRIHLLRSQIAPAELKQQLSASLAERGIPLDWEAIRTGGIQTYRYDTPEQSEIKYLLNFVLDREVKEELTESIFHSLFGDEVSAIHSDLYMSEKQVKDLARRGYLGCHSHSHYPVGLLSAGERKIEIVGSKHFLESLTQEEVFSFSYPYGSWEAVNPAHELLGSLDFLFAFTMERGVNDDLLNPFLLSRFDTNDVPGGKHYHHAPEEMYDQLPTGKWGVTHPSIPN